MEKKTSYLYFTLPSFIIISSIMLFPLGYALFYSLFSYPLGGIPKYSGLLNYFDVLKDPVFLHSVLISVTFTVIVVSCEFVFGFGIALLLDRVLVGKKMLSVLIYIPYVITASAAGVIFRWMMNPQWGIINQILKSFSIVGPNWLDHSGWAMVAVVIAEIWQNTPFVIIIMFSGLQSAPLEQMEAARIDGAGRFQVLWKVIIPHLRQLILVVFIIRTMDAWRLFDRIYAMTQGGPGDATETMVLYNFRVTFKMLRIGEGLAIGVLTLLVLCIPISIYLKTMKSSEVD